MMIVGLRLILFFICTLGIWEIVRRKTSVHVLFVPGLTAAVQTAVLLVAGWLRCLPAGVYLLLGAGIISLVYCIIHDRSLRFLKNYLNVGFLFLAAASLALFLFLYGKVFYHYDNLSHWGLVVRQMLQTNHFPDLSDELVLFRSYPLGSAAYIYFLCYTVGSKEGIMMFAQAYMMLCSLLPLFIPAVDGKRSRVWAFVLMIAAANFLLVYNIPLQDLLVDTLLPLVSMSAFLYAWYYGKRIQGKAAFVGIAFYLVQMVQIKNSGWLFAGFLILWLLLGIRRDKKILMRILVCAAPVVSAILWKLHCTLTFHGALAGKHELSFSYFLSTLKEKTPDEIRTICKAFLRFTVTWKDIWMTVGLAALVLILVAVFYRAYLRTLGKIALLAVLMFVVYQVFQLGMYLFSMPGAEAAYLAEVERYTRTILLAVIYLLLFVVMKILAEVQGSLWREIVCTVLPASALCLFIVVSQGQLTTVFYVEPMYAERDWLEERIREYQVPMGESYCIVPLEDDEGYSYYLGKYVFETTQVEDYSVQNADDLDQVTSRYIFFIGGGNDDAKAWILENYPEQAGNDVIIR